ncbi:DUF3310 domain-containing protein [Corynebacterium propinquum]
MAFYPYLIDGEHELWSMGEDFVLRQEDRIEWGTKTFATRQEAANCLPALVDEYKKVKGHLAEEIIGFGTVSVGGLKISVTQETFNKIKDAERYLPFVEDSAGNRYFLDGFEALESTTEPKRSWYFTTLEDAKRKLPYVHRTLLNDCLVDAFAKGGVVCSDEQVFSEWRQLPLHTGGPDEFYLYVEGVRGRKWFYKETGVGPAPTLDWGNAKKFSTAEDAKVNIPKLEKQLIVSEIPSETPKFGVVNGVGQLVFESDKNDRFYPYVTDSCVSKTYLTSEHAGLHRWTQFIEDAQAYPTLELAKENIQHLVELVCEDETYGPDMDFYAGVADEFEDTVFERYIAGPVPSVHETEDSDPVNSPEHYKTNGLEAIDVVEAFFVDNYLRGNVFKYIVRAGKKDPDKKVEDLEKAAWYLNREISNLKEQLD